MHAWRTILGALVALGLGAALPASAHAELRPASVADTITVDTGTADLDYRSGIDITATVAAGDSDTEDASILLQLRHVVLQDADEVRTWLDGEISAPTWGGDLQVDDYDVGALDANASATVALSATAAQLSLGNLRQASGFIPFTATLTTDAGTTVTRFVMPWNLDGEVGATRFVVPITAPASSDALYTEDQLTGWTTTGDLARMSQTLAGLPVILAIDPKIVASIDALADSSSPAQWLAQLVGSFTVVPLSYADADATALSAAGATTLPATASGTDNWAGATIAWPASTLTDGALSLYADSGYGTVAMPDSSIDGFAWGETYTVDGMAVLPVDSVLSEAIATAAADGGNAISNAVASRALGSSANVDRLVVLDRDWLSSSAHLAETIHAFSSATWLTVDVDAPSSSTIDAVPLTLTGTAAETLPADQLRTVLAAYRAAVSFSSLIVGSEGPELAQSLARQVLSIASSQWSDDSSWTEAVDSVTSVFSGYATAVRLAPQADVTLVSSSSELPVPVVNDSSYTVSVTVEVSPGTGQVVVSASPSLTIDPQSTVQALIPIRAVANGTVTLRMRLLDSAGTAVGDEVSRTMTVRAEWESRTMGVISALVVLLFGFGVFRSIRNARRVRRAAGTVDASPEASTSPPPSVRGDGTGTGQGSP